MHIEVVSNGMGSQSMMLLVLAAEGKIPARLSITGDTGSELDRVWNTGERTTAYEYFDRIIEPFASDNGIEAVMVKAQKKSGDPEPPIIDLLKIQQVSIPMYGSRGGRLPQYCTYKWKIRAVRQELRRRGAKSARCALGLTKTEVHRMKPSDVKWCQNWWPLITVCPLDREQCQTELEKRGIPYLLSTECDMCPHKDQARWKRTSDEKLLELAEIELGLPGLFFHSTRVPLLDALRTKQLSFFDDSCDSGYCFV